MIGAEEFMDAYEIRITVKRALSLISDSQDILQYTSVYMDIRVESVSRSASSFIVLKSARLVFFISVRRVG